METSDNHILFTWKKMKILIVHTWEKKHHNTKQNIIFLKKMCSAATADSEREKKHRIH